ncbi:DUF1566 domain-containing protein [Methylophaga lonarensis]|uniref:Lcl C-terminal domain-containing protein n=1 Tax=Methylophaga lonarensis TaxID=999151 RepID=UPI003D27F6B3
MKIDIKNLYITLPHAHRLDIESFANSLRAKPEKPELEWSATLCDGEQVNYEAAEKACHELGDGWRLPTRQELAGILDLSRYDPAIDIDKFPDTKNCAYWTSTPTAWNLSSAWVVYFYRGSAHSRHRKAKAYVRAVRSSQ